MIGTIELMSVLADKLALTGGVWDFVSGVDLNVVGYAIVGLFVLTWVIALAVWRFGAHRGALGSEPAAALAGGDRGDARTRRRDGHQ